MSSYHTLFHLFNNNLNEAKLSNIARISDVIILADVLCSLPSVAHLVEKEVMRWIKKTPSFYKHSPELMWIASFLHNQDIFCDAFIHMVGRMGAHTEELERANKLLSPEILLELHGEYLRISKMMKEANQAILRRVIDYPHLNTGFSEIIKAFTAKGSDDIGDRERYDIISDTYLNTTNPEDDDDRSLVQALKDLRKCNLSQQATDAYTRLRFEHLTCANPTPNELNWEVVW